MNVSGKRKIILAVLIAAALIICIVILQKILSKKEIIPGNKINNIGELIISIPETKFENYSVVYVFGGIDYATPKWLLSQTPNELLYNLIVVFCPFTKSFTDSKSLAEIFFTNNNIALKNVSIIGFSAGAIQVQTAYSDTFAFVGLIDPSTCKQYIKTKFNVKTKMIYNDANWSGYPEIQALLPQLAKKIISSGGETEKVKLRHDKIPAYFFNKYLQTLIRIEE